MAPKQNVNSEQQRLAQDAIREKNWKRWGPYLSERQWGTVREDYSEDGNCWDYFPHEQARSRAYRWGEDGLLGFTDRQCRLCFALALWNGQDDILKERLYGLANEEANHGEDVKEEYFYLDATPTHTYMKSLYKYPQTAFPYAQLKEENKKRTKSDSEFELIDSDAFKDDRYFDIMAEYAKASPNDIMIKITVTNQGPDAAPLHLLPTIWFRNTWLWGCRHEGCTIKPSITLENKNSLRICHETLGTFILVADLTPSNTPPEILFTENETNSKKLFNTPSTANYCKDAFHDYVINNDESAINRDQIGTKAAPYYKLDVPPKACIEIKLRLTIEAEFKEDGLGAAFDKYFTQRIEEADIFYRNHISQKLTPEHQNIIRQSYAGLLFTKQFYHYIVEDWLTGDKNSPKPPATRLAGRNKDWGHLFNRDIISMPDKWEYPWYAAWDLAFHMIPFAKIDPHFAKRQLKLFLREWYMHPNGQMPAYEFALSDVNPPVHAWAVWRVYKMTGKQGGRDRAFLASCFHKLLINFTWWVNRKDATGQHIFSGGFLGLDNIGVFDRSKALPGGGSLNQADGTAWMAFYCGTMLSISLELAKEDRAYEDMASKFFEHYIAISDAMNTLGGCGLWDAHDGFYYDQLIVDNEVHPLKVRSLVGLIPLIAVEIIDADTINQLPGFKKRMEWFLKYRKDLAKQISYMTCDDTGKPNPKYLFAIPSKERLLKVLAYLFDENEFLSPYGIRSLSKAHKEKPFVYHAENRSHSVSYEPGESASGLFGGNSNWRGPIWFPINYLIIEALERYHYSYGNTLTVPFPTGSDNMMNLGEIACELSKRLTLLFTRDQQTDQQPALHHRPKWKNDQNMDLLLFHEYFHGDTGAGLGASHQTGWTALVNCCFDKVLMSKGIKIPKKDV